MEVNRRTRLLAQAQAWIAIALLVGVAALVAWLSVRHAVTFDLTATGRHTLSQASLRTLGLLEGPVQITAYARDEAELRRRISSLVAQYRRHKADLTMRFVDPDAYPDLVRDRGITRNGELVLSYGERAEHLSRYTEQAFTNALLTLARGTERFVVFLDGHGERKPQGEANHDYGEFGKALERRGYRLQRFNAASTAVVPDNTALLVIASARLDPLPGELAQLRQYLERGGNLLWLAEPGVELPGMSALAAELGVRFAPGTLVDPATQLYGIDHPAILVVTSYPEHPATAGFTYATVFPQMRAIEVEAMPDWESAPLIASGEHSWSETGALEGQVGFDEGADVEGPLTLGVSLLRDITRDDAKASQQRLVVLGDGDFLSNTYLGNSGNLDLGLRLVSWLARDEALLDIPARTAPDRTLELSKPVAITIAIGFLFVAPGLLFAAGVLIRYRRWRA
jgi:ABC-type uncharacterized transport system involved in gliding motility auxiliary subunit